MPATSTALQIAQNVAYNVGLQAPSTLRNNQDRLAQQMLSLMNRGCKVLASKRGSFGESWPELVRQHNFTTTPGQADYALPPGFGDHINDTVWESSSFWEARGPLTARDYQRLRNDVISSAYLVPRYRFRLNSDTGTVRFLIDPVPGGSDDVVFEYNSFFWARESESSPIALDAVTADTHIPVFPAHLIELDLEWRIRNAQGLDYRAQIAEFENERDRLFSLAGGMRDIYMGHRVPKHELYTTIRSGA